MDGLIADDSSDWTPSLGKGAATDGPATDQDEDERVLLWRISRLLSAGYNQEQALLLAVQQGVDLHQACELLQQGCTPRTALAILI